MSENPIVKEFFDLVDKGREGKNKGCPIGLSKLEDYIGDLCSNETILVAAASGVGKTSIVLYSYLYRPLMSEDCELHDLHYCFFNFEMTRDQILAKLISIYLYETYGEILTFKDIFSRGQKDGEPNILSDEHYELLQQCTPILEKFASRIEFFPDAKTHETYIETLFDWVSKFGTFENPFNGFGENTFTPNNPEQILCVLTDHFNMLSPGPTIKATIDNIANDCVSARNMCKILTFVHIMQLNRGASGGERLKAQMYEPQESDFRDSSVVYDGSQIVITLFNPYKAQLKQHRHYDVDKLNNRYISLKILKNRFGIANISDALAFYGEINTYRELPRPEEIFDYEKYANPDWLIEPEDDESKPKFILNF